MRRRSSSTAAPCAPRSPRTTARRSTAAATSSRSPSATPSRRSPPPRRSSRRRVDDIRVRIGIHTGEPIRIDGGYVGLDVHRAARICAAGHGGQVLLSQATARPARRRAALRDLGEHHLRGVDEPERLHQLGAADFPALRADAAEVGLGARTRIVLADDSVLLREGIARLLEDAGFEIVGQAGNADELMLKVRSLLARRRDRRHPHAADPHGRRASWRPRRSARSIPGRRARPLRARRVRLRARAPPGKRRGRGVPAQGPRLGREGVRRGREARRRRRLRPRLRGRLAARGPPPRRRPDLAADAARARGARADGGRPVEPGDRGTARRHAPRRREARDEHLHTSCACPPRRTTTAACSRCSPTCASSSGTGAANRTTRLALPAYPIGRAAARLTRELHTPTERHQCPP